MPPTPETRSMVLLAAQICEDKKGTDTRILELDPVDAGFTDFFLITSGSNTRQTGAIADEVELRIKRDFGVYAKSVEGRRTGEWILLDYIDFVVHIFTEQTREFYDIERLRKSARPVATHELAAELNRKTEAARKKAPAKPAAAGQLGREDADRTDLAGMEGGALAAPAGSRAKKAASKKAPAKKIAAKKAATKVSAKKAPAKKAVKTAASKKAGSASAGSKPARVAAAAPKPDRKGVATEKAPSPRARPGSRTAKRVAAGPES